MKKKVSLKRKFRCVHVYSGICMGASKRVSEHEKEEIQRRGVEREK